MPWKAYGLVRGLKAPPRSRLAPAACTAPAMVSIRSALSTAQGPAIIARWPPPIFTPATSTTLGSGCASRLASLYGGSTGITSATPGMAWSGAGCSCDFVADHADDRAVRAAAQVGPHAVRFDALDDVADLLVRGAGFENDDHW